MNNPTRNLIVLALLAAIGLAGLDATLAQKDDQAKDTEPAAKSADKPALDKATKSKAKKAIDNGIRYLVKQQEENGSYMNNVGVTALAVKAMAKSPRAYRAKSGPFMSDAIDYILKHQKPDGSIHDGHYANYSTSLAVTALVALDNPKYKDALEKAKEFLYSSQLDEGEGFKKAEHSSYGGIGYGSGQEPDMSNTQLWADAMKALDLPKDDPAWDKVAVFATRCINDPELNDLAEFQGLKAAVNTDGGAIYQPDNSAAGTETLPDGRKAWRSYGSMTYGTMKTLIYADIPRDDPRIESLMGWIRENYTLAENPGMGLQGLYYYYATIPKALDAMETHAVTDSLGIEHNWRKELIEKLADKQRDDGSWVNTNGRWWEDQPVLVTTYSILSLIEARDGVE